MTHQRMKEQTGSAWKEPCRRAALGEVSERCRGTWQARTATGTTRAAGTGLAQRAACVTAGTALLRWANPCVCHEAGPILETAYARRGTKRYEFGSSSYENA